jgi:hypothetical protein
VVLVALVGAELDLRRTFNATLRESFVSSARYTSPMLPEPIFSRIR